MRTAAPWALVLLACSAPSPRAHLEAAPPAALDVRWVGEPEADGPVLVLLHGYGAPADDLVPLAEQLRAALGDELGVALPAAPIDLGYGLAWWPILEGPRPADRFDEHPRGLDDARLALTRWLDSMVRDGRLSPSRTTIAGFSQGGMLATDVGLRWDRRVAGIVSLSGGPVDEAEWIARASRAPPILLSHGRSDPLISFAAAERLQARLAAAGAEVTWVPFEGSHEIPGEVVSALVEFLRR